jgi:hypothetical protein
VASIAIAISFSFGTEISVYGRDIGLRGPWSWIDDLPAINGAIPVRFSLLTTLLVALVLARGLAQLRGRALAIGLVLVAATFVPLRPAHRYGPISHIETPRFFTTSAVNAIPQGATALLLPRNSSPDGEAPPMMWQIKAQLRFKIIGGYGVFNHNGKMSYEAEVPSFAQLLQDVGETGMPPNAEALATARASIAPTGTSYIVITGTQPNAALVGTTATALTGCTLQQVSDVVLCAIPGQR